MDYRIKLNVKIFTGGGRVEGLTTINIIVEDSDDVHGIIQFAEEGHTIITVS